MNVDRPPSTGKLMTVGISLLIHCYSLFLNPDLQILGTIRRSEHKFRKFTVFFAVISENQGETTFTCPPPMRPSPWGLGKLRRPTRHLALSCAHEASWM